MVALGGCVIAPGGHVWLLPGGVCGCSWGGMHGCSQGGVHGEGGCLAKGGMRGKGRVCMVCTAGHCAGGTHPTGMHSCLKI